MLTLETGQALTIWSARVAAALFLLAWVLRWQARADAYARVGFVGFLFYLLHVTCAFEFFYDWDHSTAYRETARQSRELFGVEAGAGLYLNYVFTVLWAAECVLSWLRPERWKRIRTGVHAFLLFMVLNGSVVVWLLRAMR